VATRTRSARRYAEAAFSLASEQNALDRWGDDLSALAAFADEGDVAPLLRSNRLPREEKLRLVEAGVGGLLSPLAMNLARLLSERGNLHLAREVERAFREMLDDARGLAHATVTTAVPLSGDERTAIAARLSSMTGKQVDVSPVVDESIIGGLIARIGDQLIDGSTRTRLVALKRRLETASR